MDLNVVDRFKLVIPALSQAETSKDVMKVCRAISGLGKSHLQAFEKHYKEETYLDLNPSGSKLVSLLIDRFGKTKDLELQKLIIKAMLIPGLCMNYFHMELLFDSYRDTHGELAAECLRDYTWLQNYSFTKKFGVSFPEKIKIVLPFLKLSSMSYSDETKYFALTIENMITGYETRIIQKVHPDVFKAIFMNLENCHQNVRALLLELFKRIVEKTDDCIGDNMVLEVSKLPWTNRNKFALLTNLVMVKPELLENHPSFNLDLFTKGLFVGLTQHHLHSPSQALVKIIHVKDPFSKALLEAIATVLWEGENDSVAENLTKFWFSVLETSFLEKLYVKLKTDKKLVQVPTTSKKFHRLLVIRNAFKKIFNDNELDRNIKEFWCDFDDLSLKVEVFHLLVDRVQAEPHPDNVLTLFRFLRFNMCSKDSSFVDHHVMRKLPEVFSIVALKKLRKVEAQQQIFKIIRDDLCLNGFQLGSYEAVSFSLKTLNIIMKQFFGGEKLRTNKSNSYEANSSFGEFLKVNDIWDVTSTQTFNLLMKLVDDKENSDLSDLAMKILTEFFVQKSKIKAIDNLDETLLSTLNNNDISTARGALRYFILKFELALMNKTEVCEILAVVDLLKKRFTKLRQDNDPVKSMQEGLHLFNVIECVNYGIKRMNSKEFENVQKVILVLKVLIKLIVNHFLGFINDPNLVMSFENVDYKLSELTENMRENKSKLLLFIFYTLRASSEVSETLATIVQSSDVEFSQTLSTCIDVNIQILTRSCHKGAIEKASEALGKITKMISNEFLNLCERNSKKGRNLQALLLILKKEIDCGERVIGDTRSSRGLILMAQKIIVNHPPFLRFLMEKLFVTNKISSFIEIRFIDNLKPIQLHLLSMLVKDSAIVEDMLKYLHFILLATLKAYKNSSDFVMLNSLLQVIGAIVPKISNQKRQNVDTGPASNSIHEPKSVSVHEFCVKFPGVFQISLVDLQHGTGSFPEAYIIILLEIFTNFEHRGEECQEVVKLQKVFKILLHHRCEKIRTLAGRCYVQFMEINDKMLEQIENSTDSLFESNPNVVHSTVNKVRFMIQRYENFTKFVENFDLDEFKLKLRRKISNEFKSQKFIGATNFFIRFQLLDFLMFIDFLSDDEVVKSLPCETGLKNHFGYKLWTEKLKN